MGDKYRPKTGDRVRVVLEGETFPSWTKGFYVGASVIIPGEKEVVSVEKIEDPLPTTPGSVIVRYSREHDKSSPVFVRRSLIAGLWRDLSDQGPGWLTPSDPTLDHYDTEYDAGKAL